MVVYSTDEDDVRNILQQHMQIWICLQSIFYEWQDGRLNISCIMDQNSWVGWWFLIQAPVVLLENDYLNHVIVLIKWNVKSEIESISKLVAWLVVMLAKLITSNETSNKFIKCINKDGKREKEAEDQLNLTD